VIGVTTASLAAGVVLLLRALLRMRRMPVSTGAEALIGKTGVVVSELAPEGKVRVNSEVWTARVADGVVRAGEQVRVLSVEGVTLRVTKDESAGSGR
jgi:membrane-bound serine protease (ClpP class)